jgi:membrane-associated phospholipid phosphatase
MKTRSFLHLAILCIVTAGSQAREYVGPGVRDDITHIGGALSYVLPAAAVGVVWGHHDKEGFWQFAKSSLATGVVVVGLKYSLNLDRPNGDPYSFPSGHAAFAFGTAEFLRKRFGWKYGAPAYVLAGFDSWTRVRANEHFYEDVAAGAAMGLVSSYFFTTPYHGFHVQPQVSARSARLVLSRDF